MKKDANCHKSIVWDFVFCFDIVHIMHVYLIDSMIMRSLKAITPNTTPQFPFPKLSCHYVEPSLKNIPPPRPGTLPFAS